MHALVRLLRVYCLHLPSLVESHLSIIIDLCRPFLVDQFSLPHVFGIFYSLFVFLGEPVISPILSFLSPQVLTDSNIPEFAEQFAVFLSYLCVSLAPDRVLVVFDREALPAIVTFWSHGVEIGGPLAFPGCMKAVKNSTLLTADQQAMLVKGLYTMLCEHLAAWWGYVEAPPPEEWLTIMNGDDSPQRLECTNIPPPVSIRSQPERDTADLLPNLRNRFLLIPLLHVMEVIRYLASTKGVLETDAWVSIMKSVWPRFFDVEQN
jgi:hypothetical protein